MRSFPAQGSPISAVAPSPSSLADDHASRWCEAWPAGSWLLTAIQQPRQLHARPGLVRLVRPEPTPINDRSAIKSHWTTSTNSPKIRQKKKPKAFCPVLFWSVLVVWVRCKFAVRSKLYCDKKKGGFWGTFFYTGWLLVATAPNICQALSATLHQKSWVIMETLKHKVLLSTVAKGNFGPSWPIADQQADLPGPGCPGAPHQPYFQVDIPSPGSLAA